MEYVYGARSVHILLLHYKYIFFAKFNLSSFNVAILTI